MNKNATSFEKTKIAFMSDGIECVGYLYRPIGVTGKLPCVVMANGFSGTMDWLLPTYAERFALAGLSVLMFDYRYFGESKGEPRQLVSVRRQRQDIREAIKFARNHPGIDAQYIALWGTSLGGGHVIALAAEDPNIAAVVAQVPGIDMVSPRAKATIKIPASTLFRLLGAAVKDALRGAFGMSPHYAKVFGKPGELAIFTDPALSHRFDALKKGSPTWRNEFTPRFYLALPRYTNGTAQKIKAPLLVCIADKEVYANPDFQEWVAKQAPRGEVKRYQGGHFDFYHDMLEQVVTDEIAFLHKHLV
jgi:dienelactone hydrolase